RSRRNRNAQPRGGLLILASTIRAEPRIKQLVACLVLPLAIGELACTGAAAAATLPVTNCNDDGNGSLRAALAAAHSGDTIDMTGLTCGKISLATGEVSVPVDNLTLQGPGANLLTIAGAQDIRHNGVFHHTGTGTLRIDALNIIDSFDYYGSSCIDSSGTVYLNRSIVSECSSGAVLANGFRSRDSTISNSYPGVHTTGGSVEIIGSTISGNSTGFGCSALRVGDYGTHSQAPVLISNSTISGNGGSLYYSDYAVCIN